MPGVCACVCACVCTCVRACVHECGSGVCVRIYIYAWIGCVPVRIFMCVTVEPMCVCAHVCMPGVFILFLSSMSSFASDSCKYNRLIENRNTTFHSIPHSIFIRGKVLYFLSSVHACIMQYKLFNRIIMPTVL